MLVVLFACSNPRVDSGGGALIDPAASDSDGDRLADGDEIDLGTDPALPDTDGDGYLDGDEVTEGLDPLDPSSVIYQGGWPYWWDKDSITGGRRDDAASGQRFARFVLLDQFGEDVDVWDFYGDGRPVILHMCVMWGDTNSEPGSWCDVYPKWILGHGPFADLWSEVDPVRDAILDGRVHFVTVVVQGAGGLPPTSEEVAQQAELNTGVAGPVLLDPDYRVQDYVGTLFYPFGVLLDSELLVVDTGTWGDMVGVLGGALEMIGDGAE